MSIRPPHRRSPLSWVAREGWFVWAVLVLIGAVMPVAAIFGFDESDMWSLTASLVHAGEFAIFTILVAVAWRHRVPSSTGLLPAAALSALFGLLVELVQWPLSWRDASAADFVFDALGIAVGALLLTIGRAARGARPWARG